MTTATAEGIQDGREDAGRFRREMRGRRCPRCGGSRPVCASFEHRLDVGEKSLVTRDLPVCGACSRQIVEFIDAPMLERARASSIDLSGLIAKNGSGVGATPAGTPSPLQTLLARRHKSGPEGGPADGGVGAGPAPGAGGTPRGTGSKAAKS